MASPDEDVPFCTFIDSRIIHAFGPILRSAAQDFLRFWDGGLFLYPHQDGVLCIATDGRAMMMMLDREARVDVPRNLHLPEELIAACAPPKPFVAHYPGWQEEKPLPEWMQPGSVMLFRSGVSLFARMHHPADVADYDDLHTLFSRSAAFKSHRMLGRDYWHAKPRLDPLRALASAPDPEMGADLDPNRVAMFGAAMDVFNPPAVTWTPGGPGGAVVFLMDGVPDFIGFLMPLKVAKRPTWPAFACDLVASYAAAAVEERRTEVAEGRP
ncbi:hypothetical protein [Aureimonas sp. D3]|uniref:hypothetical protein n=1 Tax=Aureimonas sp. D3 TaxID=1638164 RepID=UPI000782FA7C|nr:hypothetical protein [Aureimonas sp. D3]